MRTLLAISGVVAALALANITLTIRTIDATMQLVLLRTDEIPRRVEAIMPTTITKYHYNEDGQLVLQVTYTQGPNESYHDFLKRVAEEWAAAVAALG